MSRLYKIGVGRAQKGRSVKLLIADQSIRVVDLEGQLIRELNQIPLAATNLWHATELSTMSRDICLRCLETQQSGARGTRTPDLLGAIQALSQLSYSPACALSTCARP
jgi:hypothetical protein